MHLQEKGIPKHKCIEGLSVSANPGENLYPKHEHSLSFHDCSPGCNPELPVFPASFGKTNNIMSKAIIAITNHFFINNQAEIRI